ncbi:hypothetical protein KIPB_014019, partial [Kipferlia bialata]
SIESVNVRILANHGAKYTCLYRVHVWGQAA